MAGYLSAAPVPATLAPKALIAPHAGYIYSGQIAANAYAAWRSQRDNIERVVLIGPAHRAAFHGIAVPKAEAFKTPLGDVPIDDDAVAAIRNMPQVLLDDEPHRQEHSLEVHIPFLQQVLGDFTLLPLVSGVPGRAGRGSAGTSLGQRIDALRNQYRPSHCQDYELAKRLDGATAEAIETMHPAAISEIKLWPHSCCRDADRS